MIDEFTAAQIEHLLVQRRYAKGEERAVIDRQLADQGVTVEDVANGVRWFRSVS